MSYSIEQFILDSGITRAEVDEAKASDVGKDAYVWAQGDA